MLAALVTTLEIAGALEIADRTEIRVRAPGTTAAAALDLETAPVARLSLGSRRLRITLGYTPRLTLWDVGSAVQPAAWNGGDARVEWLGRLVRVALEENAGYGTVDLASSPAAPGTTMGPPTVALVPGLSLLPTMSSTTTLTSRLTLRRWTFATTAGYQLAGGATASARSILPLEQGPFGEASADYAATRRDHVVMSLAASDTTFSSGQDAAIVEPALGYRRVLSRTTEASLKLGVGEAWTRASPGSAEGLEAHPAAEGVVERRSGADGQLDARAAVRIGPVVNPLFGVVDERAGASLTASYRLRRLTAHAFVDGSRSVPAGSVYATSFVAGEVGAAYRTTRLLSLDCGARWIWQRQDATGASFAQGTLFVGATLRAPPARL
jgi:hypothetical protein